MSAATSAGATGALDALTGALPGIMSAMSGLADASAQMAVNEAINNFKENIGAAIASVINGAGSTIEHAAAKQ
jgi:hypothetical protein